MRFRGWDRIDSRRAVLGSTAGRWDLAAAKPPPAVAAETGPRGKRGSSSRPALARSPDLVVIPTMPTRLFLGSAFLNRKSFFLVDISLLHSWKFWLSTQCMRNIAVSKKTDRAWYSAVSGL